ncbi:Pleckstrin homology domain-containing family A member 8 [Smittium culicis]|uniref:Pleckstrin homology domain-containing family A member 8 n=1 Tax=Smittium culicis TaxID=133412 RepID=A0A1R1XNA8_9FUNG|nr:Pleckstrin homology domain-containing family A member 8 [Smittium culicis]OMJ16102.1 Pleckstrin homology domain-containing family A member 8 [Smittium culicis]
MASTPFLEKVPLRFEQVNIREDGIDTVQFLEAAKGVMYMFDELGSAAFAPVKSDISGNITKVTKKYESDKVRYDTLQKIVLSEAQTKDRTATQGLLWLKRGLDFAATAIIKNLEAAGEELSVSFSKAYDETLKQFHSFLIRPVFSLAMRACPKSTDFYNKIGGDSQTTKDELLVWAKALKNLISILDDFYAKGKFDKGL